MKSLFPIYPVKSHPYVFNWDFTGIVSGVFLLQDFTGFISVLFFLMERRPGKLTNEIIRI